MTETIYLISGILLVVLIFLDILFTTYSMEGGGKLTDFFLRNTWNLFVQITGFNGRNRLLKYVGMVMMISLIFFWGLGLWFGVFLIFASDPESVLVSDTNLPAEFSEKFYYAGYVLSTLGLGDLKPVNATWGFVTSFFSFFGMVFITLMVSYALPVLSKIIEKKQFSLFIHHFGNTPQELLLYFWNGKDFSNLKSLSQDLQQKILLLGKSHKAYPILHYFHSSSQRESLVITICLIDEALSILIHQIAPHQWDEKDVLPLRKAISEYMDTLKETYRYDQKKSSPRPQVNLNVLAASQIKIGKEADIDLQRKDVWFHILKAKGWTWKEIYIQ